MRVRGALCRWMHGAAVGKSTRGIQKGVAEIVYKSRGCDSHNVDAENSCLATKLLTGQNKRGKP